MLLLVDMTHPDNYDTAGGHWSVKRRLEVLSGRPCLVTNFPQVTPEYVASLPIAGVFISGFGYGWDKVPVDQLVGVSDLLHTTELPVLAACGGHQLMGFAFNCDLRRVAQLADEPMRRLAPGEPDWRPEYHAGWYMEAGIHEVAIVQPDPLFEGLPTRIRVPEAHYCEIKTLPPGFRLLASTGDCRIQAMRHETRPLYGLQFHAEAWTDDYPDGRQVIANFVRMVYPA